MNLIHPIRGLTRVGLDPDPLNLFLHAGWWQVACPSCGLVLAQARRQSKAEAITKRTTCPICTGGAQPDGRT